MIHQICSRTSGRHRGLHEASQLEKFQFHPPFHHRTNTSLLHFYNSPSKGLPSTPARFSRQRTNSTTLLLYIVLQQKYNYLQDFTSSFFFCTNRTSLMVSTSGRITIYLFTTTSRELSWSYALLQALHRLKIFSWH